MCQDMDELLELLPSIQTPSTPTFYTYSISTLLSNEIKVEPSPSPQHINSEEKSITSRYPTMNSVGPLNLSSSPPPEPPSFGRPTGSGRTHSGSSLSGSTSSIYSTRLAASIPVESRFGSATSRFTSDLVAFLNRIGDRLPARWRPYFWPGLWFGFVALVIGLLVGFHSKIFAALESIATFIKNLGPLYVGNTMYLLFCMSSYGENVLNCLCPFFSHDRGPPVIMTALFIASFPPMVGYSSIVTMSGMDEDLHPSRIEGRCSFGLT